MGRPRKHNEQTRVELRDAAERIITAGGLAAFSVRAVAQEANTTTRAVYSLFESKEGLLVDALAQRAFEFLVEHIDRIEETDDPAADLIAVGVPMFRRFILERPALYRIAFQRIVPEFRPGPEVVAARTQAWSRLMAKVRRLGEAGLLGNHSATEAAVAFNAMVEGLANAELRGTVLPNLPEGQEEQAWRRALATLVTGFAAT